MSEHIGPRLGFALVAALIFGLMWLAIADDQAFEKHCASLGGHVKTLTSTGVGTDSNGKSVVTTSSTDLCLSSDGRILDTH